MKRPKQDIIADELNRLMAEELEAFLRYFQLRHRLRRVDRMTAKFFDQTMKETLEHAEAIASHLRALGLSPKLSIKLKEDGGPLGLKEALKEALIFEQQALEAYREMLPRVMGKAGLADFIRKQVAIESEHVREIEVMLH